MRLFNALHRRYFLLAILTISIPAVAAQSWITVIVQADNYGAETTWEITQGTDIVATSPAYGNNSYNETFVELSPGGYNFVIYDEYGDGICCDFGEGFFGLANNCGLNTFVYDFNGPTATVYFDLLACPPPVYGCMEVDAINFNPWANSPSPCTFPPAPCAMGQTNIILLTTPDSYPGETSWELTANGEIISSGGAFSSAGVTVPSYVCVNEGDTLVATIYDSYGDGLCGTCWGGVDGYFNVTTLCGDSIFMAGGETQFDTLASGPYVVPACFAIELQGCTDPGYVEYNPDATGDDNSCETLVALGCTDITMFNYDVLANTMDVEPSCGYTLTTTDGGADGWFGSWLGLTQGDNIYGPYQMGLDDGYEKDFTLDLSSNEEVKVYFFTGGNAETTAAQCGFRLEGPNGILLESGTNPWTDPLKKFPFNYVGVPTCSNYCVEIIANCTDPEAQNFTIGANTEDGSCYYSAGCMQPGYVEYYNQGYVADFDDGSCIELAVFGCMDELALNYELEANVDIDNCIDIEVGCTDPDSYNYSATANVEDNTSCLYEAPGCVTGLGEPYGDGFWLNDSCFSWVITIDPYCCETAWDNSCVSLYEYCSEGWPTDIVVVDNEISIYPNPVTDRLYVVTTLQVSTELYNSGGQLIRTAPGTIEMSDLPSGMYQAVIRYNNRLITKKIVKQ